MSLTRLDLWRALLGASLSCWCSLAVAEESNAARLFREGRALLVEGRFAEACPQLEQSQRLEPRLGTQLNIAFCRERLGKLATAWLAFQEAASAARREGDSARERFATARVAVLAPRVPWLELRAAAGADGLTVLLDGAPLASISWGQERPVDPGPHTISAWQDGEEYWRTTVVLRESEHAQLAIPAPPAQVSDSSPVLAHSLERSADQRSADPRSAPPPSAARGFVYEVGAFVGFIAVDTRQSSPEDGPASIHALVPDEDGTSQRVSCANLLCDYPSIGASSGVVGGVAGFVGHALTTETDLGLRFLLGPRGNGGALVVFGPSASIPFAERFRVGPSLLIGTASHVEADTVQLAASTSFASVSSRLQGNLGFSVGLGVDLSWTFSSSTSGSFVLQTTPLYLSGSNGSAWSLPLGAAYRWH